MENVKYFSHKDQIKMELKSTTKYSTFMADYDDSK
jgi:hypothetical protein